jgi:hypothetical protein
LSKPDWKRERQDKREREREREGGGGEESKNPLRV